MRRTQKRILVSHFLFQHLKNYIIFPMIINHIKLGCTVVFDKYFAIVVPLIFQLKALI